MNNFRYLVLGNHRDAWIYGSVDPNSATACMMEMVRVFGSMMKKGWRPRRTIVFASWGAGEHGYMGSLEWIEEFQTILSDRTVAHVNVDLAVIHTFNMLGKLLLSSCKIKRMQFGCSKNALRIRYASWHHYHELCKMQ